jgi:hypothetical protein
VEFGQQRHWLAISPKLPQVVVLEKARNLAIEKIIFALQIAPSLLSGTRPTEIEILAGGNIVRTVGVIVTIEGYPQLPSQTDS